MCGGRERHQKTHEPKSSCLATGIACLGGRSAPTKEHRWQGARGSVCLQHAESAFDGYNRGGAFFPRRKARRTHAPPCTSSTIAQVTTSKHRNVKRQFTITHAGERWIDSGGDSWAELSALKI